ncbi:hypothetical protein SCA6_016308 [Theobroma cacao]
MQLNSISPTQLKKLLSPSLTGCSEPTFALSSSCVGDPTVLDYCATKVAIVAFTRGLVLQLVKKGIRVNGVAPGPAWTPLPSASLPEEMINNFGSEVPMGRAAQPYEIAPCYVFLASPQCSSYFSGQFLHPNGQSSDQLNK